jgi:hypothetical protein
MDEKQLAENLISQFDRKRPSTVLADVSLIQAA